MTADTSGLPSVLPRVAAAVAFLVAGGLVLGVMNGQVGLLLLAAIPTVAGIGMLRWRSWSAYGLALFEFAQLLILPVLLLRAGSGSLTPGRIAVMVGFSLGLVILFAAAGRSLVRAVGPRGRPWPWILVAVVCTLPWFFMEAFQVPSGGMENTLLLGDRVLVRTLPKGTLSRGDLVVFLYPSDRRQTFIKRVVGVGGDRIHLAGKTLYRNGMALTEPYVVHRFPFDSYRDNFPTGVAYFPLDARAREMLRGNVVNGEVVVPAGKYFVLGDNRDVSLDSRYWGFLDSAEVIGKPWLVYDSQRPAAAGTPASRFEGIERVRWDRMFKVL